MANLETYTIGYKEEAVFGTRVVAGTPTVVTYIIGQILQIPLPTEKPVVIRQPVITSYDPAAMKYGAKEVMFELDYNLIEGNILNYILGEVSEGGGGGPTYVHTITPSEPTDSTTFESRTFHIETNGLTTDKLMDICGAVAYEFNLGWQVGNIGVQCSEKLIAQRITDENATSDISGTGSAGSEDDAKAYTNPPVYHDTNLTEADQWVPTEMKLAGSNIISSIKGGNINIKMGYEAPRTNRTGFNNYGSTINRYITDVYRKQGAREYLITLNVIPDDNTIAFFDALQTDDYDNDLIITMARTAKSSGNAHEIKFTFDTSTCLVADISGIMNYALKQDMGWTVLLMPRTLTNCVLTNEQATI